MKKFQNFLLCFLKDLRCTDDLIFRKIISYKLLIIWFALIQQLSQKIHHLENFLDLLIFSEQSKHINHKMSILFYIELREVILFRNLIRLLKVSLARLNIAAKIHFYINEYPKVKVGLLLEDFLISSEILKILYTILDRLKFMCQNTFCLPVKIVEISLIRHFSFSKLIKCYSAKVKYS